MKIIIAGDGKVGLTLTQKLAAAGHDLTLIDSNQRVLDSSVERYDVMGVQGNCASMRVLESADVKKADLLIAATSSDFKYPFSRIRQAVLYHAGCLFPFAYGESGKTGGARD